jgi:major membrane immunogen (membrane-anchored lipoprotein)
MKVKYITLAVIVAALLVALPGSCSTVKYPLKDGYYSAEAAEFDAQGWKDYVTICVSNGRITMVEFNAFNASGYIKSWDMNYMRQMNAISGTYPNAYTRYYEGRLLSQQGTEGINALSGATVSYHSFIQLTESALAKARQGNTETSLVLINQVVNY